jgi:hypothetical protein
MSPREFASLMESRGYTVKQDGEGWRTACPAHGGTDPNMTIRQHTEGGTICTCHSHHCSRSDIAKALGLTMADLTAPKTHVNGVEPLGRRIYPYRDEHGTTLFEVIREPDKQFWQRLPGAEKGGIGSVRRVLFGLPELLLTRQGDLICIAEGEKCAVEMAKLGIPSTTNPHGACHWRPEYTAWLKQHLADRKFLVLGDNDLEGKKHVVQVCESLQAAGLEYYLADLGPLPDKGDVVEWIRAGGTAEQLRAMAAPSPKTKRQIERAEERRIISARDLLAKSFEPLRWAIPEMIPEGLTIFAGGPKTGKSWMAMHMAIAIASGGRIFGQIPVERGEVLYLALEDSYRRLQDRLLKCLQGEAAPDGLYLVTYWDLLGEGFTEALDEWLGVHPDCRLVIVDIFEHVRPKNKKDKPEYQEDTAVMKSLQEMPREHRVAMVLIHHTRKTPSLDSVDTVHGSQGITGGVDTVLVLQRRRDQKNAILHVVSRECDTVSKAMEWDGVLCCWKLLGDANMNKLSAEREEIRCLLQHAKTDLGPTEIAGALGMNPGAVRYLLGQMVSDGQITRSHYGKYCMTEIQKLCTPPLTPLTP